MIFVHKVGDFEKFKSRFESNALLRKQFGSTGATAYRSLENPDEVVVISDWGNKEQAKKWSESEQLKDSWKSVGATGLPKIYYID